jgi:hypothetical protein
MISGSKTRVKDIFLPILKRKSQAFLIVSIPGESFQ